jgi:5-methylcytosine-specific restriction enzyme A
MGSRRIGEALNERWKVLARHSLYHREGTWYHQLTRFPGALCDPYGYVLFATREEFLGCPKLRIDKDVNVNGHLSEIPGYVRVPKAAAYIPAKK